MLHTPSVVVLWGRFSFCTCSPTVLYEYGMALEKPFLNHPELIDRLQVLGMTVDHPDSAARELRRLGYHRTASYRYVFRQLLPRAEQNPQAHEYRRDEFMAGARFEDSISLATFDTELREVCARGLLDFEIRLRTAVAHVLASHSPDAHLNPSYLDGTECNKRTNYESTKFQAWRATYDRCVKDNKHNDFVAHHKVKYGTDLPVWATMEILTFGSIPYLMDLMKPQDKDAVANRFGVRHGTTFATWVRAMGDFRNVCAHGSRLFNSRSKRSIAIQTTAGVGPELDHLINISSRTSQGDRSKLYWSSALLAYFLRKHESGTTWHWEFANKVNELPAIHLGNNPQALVTPERNMGFPHRWKDLDLWSDRTGP